MPTTIPVTATPHWTAWVLPLALILITAFYAVQTWRLTKHAKAEVDEMVRQHREEREERRRLAFHAVRVELEQIRDACKDKRPQPTPLPTHSWDTSRGEIASDEAIVNAVLSVYGYVSRCNALYDSRVADTTRQDLSDKYLPSWQGQAAKTYECACAALEHLNADQAGGEADKESA